MYAFGRNTDMPYSPAISAFGDEPDIAEYTP
jgi:hypothetical protein